MLFSRLPWMLSVFSLILVYFYEVLFLICKSYVTHNIFRKIYVSHILSIFLAYNLRMRKRAEGNAI